MTVRPAPKAAAGPEWPTLALVAGCYLLWGLATTVLAGASPAFATLATAVLIAQFSSIQHEVLHGHPFRSRWLNEALVFPALTVLVPYGRFRDTHLAHHHDEILTDPYDDPESNYLDPAVWARLSAPLKALLRFNNTLLGRMLVGPAIGQASFMAADLRAIRGGDRAVARAWVLHLAGLVPVLGWLATVGEMSPGAYLLAAYGGHSILKIRTFLEHRAHERARGRSVIVEDRGPLAFLFLNNNFHAVHHAHPGVPWYRLPAFYAARRDRFLALNEGYRYPSYGAIFRRHLLAAKDPVPHPLWPLRRR
ncbi:MAG: fatty acid desaturase [Rhodobacteraceae bacterium]|nr:fatty acid desaturase [Paracoccaceae bacterium]